MHTHLKNWFFPKRKNFLHLSKKTVLCLKKKLFFQIKRNSPAHKRKKFLIPTKNNSISKYNFFLYYEKTTIWTKNFLHLSERGNFSNQNVSYICPEKFLYICLKKTCFPCAKNPFLDKLFLKAYFKTSFLDVFYSAHNTNYSETNFLILSYFISIPN